ncbi:MAG TPA: homoserine kinase [Candidatus Dormibacteraeota bacterium]|jgi:homoserine kinase|nr:homoserine kinase [Candidatus Dormibacteraeota bacterium]
MSGGRVIRAPASIANLGPGFDILAMAVDLWLEVEAEPSESPQWSWEGEGAHILSTRPNPISVLPFKGRVRNGIPLGVGLGSSAAARLVASILRDPEGNAFDAAAASEGHPDNVAASYSGGLVAVVRDKIHKLPSPDLEIALLVASEPFATERAREVLPVRISRADAVANAGSVGLLVHVLHTRQWELLGTAMEDLLHQPYRLELYPWVLTAMRAATAAGALGSAVAGAGPSLFAFCQPGTGQAVAAAMAASAPRQGRPLVTRVTDVGMSSVPLSLGQG